MVPKWDKQMKIQVGMGCVNDALCDQIGWGLGAIIAVALLTFTVNLVSEYFKLKTAGKR